METLETVLQGLSEESVYNLLLVVQRRARKQALAVNAGKDAGDLVELRQLQQALTTAHASKFKQSDYA